MGHRFEIKVWQQNARPNGEYGWDTIWSGNSRFRVVSAFFTALGGRQGRPLQLTWHS